MLINPPGGLTPEIVSGDASRLLAKSLLHPGSLASTVYLIWNQGGY